MDDPERMAPSAWERLPGEVEGVPLWKRRGEACYVATRDTDRLLIIDAALTAFDRMDRDEFRNFVRGRPAVNAIRLDAHRVLGTPPSTLYPTTSERKPVARPKSSDAVYLKIAAALRDRIHGGVLKPGDKLPSEAEISAEFGVARGTTREALKQLEDDGLVDTLPGVGRIVHSTEQTNKTPLYRRIAADLIAAIESGDYPPGSQLPGEAQLAEQFQASRNTIRSALSELDGRGLIEVVHGKGRIVLTRITDT
ncbi:MAG: winged helix-turn-helix domain-containing protein [Pseudonocardiaceae bacterium]